MTNASSFLKPIQIDWEAVEAVQGTFRAMLRTRPNPDHGQTRAPKAPLVVRGRFVEVVRAAHAYAAGIGGGNWVDPVVEELTPDRKEPRARVSYNGRIWPPGRWQPGLQALYEVAS